MAINTVINAKNEETFFLEFQIHLFLISMCLFSLTLSQTSLTLSLTVSCVQFDSLYKVRSVPYCI
jgi:hypothetical protein